MKNAVKSREDFFGIQISTVASVPFSQFPRRNNLKGTKIIESLKLVSSKNYLQSKCELKTFKLERDKYIFITKVRAPSMKNISLLV